MPKDPVAELRDAAWAAWWAMEPMHNPAFHRLLLALRAFDEYNGLYCMRCKHRLAEGPLCSDPSCNCGAKFNLAYKRECPACGHNTMEKHDHA